MRYRVIACQGCVNHTITRFAETHARDAQRLVRRLSYNGIHACDACEAVRAITCSLCERWTSRARVRRSVVR